MIYGRNDKQYANIHIPIKSDAYVSGIPDFIKENPNNYAGKLAGIHRLLYGSGYTPKSEDVYYDKITIHHLSDLVLLHREWFPVAYNKDYFKKFLAKSSYYNQGAFIKIANQPYLIGCLLGEVCTESKFHSNVKGVLRKKKWYQNIFTANDKCGYLNTIGVIDEFRKLKIGSVLLEKFVEEMKRRKCVALFLHTIEHNISSIKFYEKNNWNHGGVIPKFYLMNDNTLYEAEVFYLILESKEEFHSVKIGEVDQNGIIRTRGCCKSFCMKIRRIINA